MKNPHFVGLMLMAIVLLASCDSNSSDKNIKRYIQNHPDEIILSVLKYRNKKRAEADGLVKSNTPKLVKDLFRSGALIPIYIGNKSNLYSSRNDKFIIEFMDYNCGFCKKSSGQMNEILKEHKDFNFFILPASFLSESSDSAIESVYELMKKKGDYAALHEQLLTIPKVDESSSEKVYEKFGVKKSELSEWLDRLNNNKAFFKNLGIKATPTFITQKGRVEGLKPDEIRKMLSN